MTGPLAGGQPGPDPLGGTRYARQHPLAPQQTASPDANRLRWYQEIRPTAAVSVLPGCLLVKMANAGRTSAGGHHVPGDVIALPYEEARSLINQGLAREVRRG
jgi:hypothetical protein